MGGMCLLAKGMEYLLQILHAHNNHTHAYLDQTLSSIYAIYIINTCSATKLSARV